MEIAPPIIGQEDVDCFCAGVGAIAGGDDGVVDCVDDVRVRVEECVGFYLFEGKGDGFAAEGAADFLQGVEGGVCGVLYEIDVGEAALMIE